MSDDSRVEKLPVNVPAQYHHQRRGGIHVPYGCEACIMEVRAQLAKLDPAYPLAVEIVRAAEQIGSGTWRENGIRRLRARVTKYEHVVGIITGDGERAPFRSANKEITGHAF